MRQAETPDKADKAERQGRVEIQQQAQVEIQQQAQAEMQQQGKVAMQVRVAKPGRPGRPGRPAAQEMHKTPVALEKRHPLEKQA